MAGHSPIIAVVSPKGGVGKTTLAANLGAALAARGRACWLVDLDPQNALRLHFGMPVEDPSGLAVQTLEGAPWTLASREEAEGLSVLPFGTLTEPDRARLEGRLAQEPGWFEQGLASLGLADEATLIVDTPPGGTIYLHQVLRVATATLCVLLADAASYVTVPTLKRWLEAECEGRPGFTGNRFVLNRYNDARALCRDVERALVEQLRDELCPVRVRFDAAVEEALASQMPVNRYAPETLAARDLAALAEWLETRL